MSRDHLFRGAQWRRPWPLRCPHGSRLLVLCPLSGGAAGRLHALAIAARRPPAGPWVLQPQRPRAPSRPRPIRPGPRVGARPSALKLPGFRERTPLGWSAVPFSSHRPFSLSLGPLESRRGEPASLGCIQQVTGLSSLPRPKTGSYFV